VYCMDAVQQSAAAYAQAAQPHRAELQTAWPGVRWHIKRASGAKGTENPDMKRPI
jgi:hypothetical protein